MIQFGQENHEMRTAPFLIRAIEEMNNALKVIVATPIAKEKGTIIDAETSELNHLLSTCVPLSPDENNVYEILFENYIFHIIRNESFTLQDNYGISKGKYFIVFDQSRLLDCLPQLVEQSILEAYFPSGWKHYGIYCQNHIIDVIAAEEPKVKSVSCKI